MLAVIYGVGALYMANISHVDPIHMGDVPWMRDTHTVHARQRVGSAWLLAARETTAVQSVDSRHKWLSGKPFQSKC